MSRVLTTRREHAPRLARLDSAEALVVGLCAAWCGTCRAFEQEFARVAEAYPASLFVWLDVEDDSGIAGDVEVENFPTLAVFRGATPVHFGVSLPQPGAIIRLVSALLEGDPRPVSVAAEVAQLPALLLAHARTA